MLSVIVKQGEAKTLKFTIKSEGSVIDVSDPILVSFILKKQKADTVPIFSKANADFDKTDAANGVVTVPISASDTNQDPGLYVGEIKVIFASDNIDKSADLGFKIEEAVG